MPVLAEMSPVLAKKYGPLELILANFDDPADVPAVDTVEVVHDAGNGVVLWRVR